MYMFFYNLFTVKVYYIKYRFLKGNFENKKRMLFETGFRDSKSGQDSIRNMSLWLENPEALLVDFVW